MAIRTDTAAFQIAGFADSSNRMGRPVKSADMRVPPQIEAQGDRLVWGWLTDRRDEHIWVTPGNRMISDFVKLASERSTEPFVKFAKRYGVFSAEELPMVADWPRDSYKFGNKLWRVWGSHNNWEPIEFWREVSRNARAMLRIAAQLNEIPPRPGDLEDWQVLEGGPCEEEQLDPELRGIQFDAEENQDWLQEEVNGWLRAGVVGLRIKAQHQREGRTIWETEVMCGDRWSSLFGAIALQLMLLIAGAETLYTCAGCGFPYSPAGRRTKRGLNTYCGDCGAEAARRDADRRRKDKMIEARRLYADGELPEEIANKLNVRSVASVRRWVKKGRLNVKKARSG